MTGVRLGLEGGALMVGLVLLEKEKETQDLFPPPLPLHGKIQQGSRQQTKERVLARHGICWYLDLGHPASKRVRKKCLLLFKPPSLWTFVPAARIA